MARIFVCSECAPELYLDSPTSAGYSIRNSGRCRHVDELIQDEIKKHTLADAKPGHESHER